MLVELNNYIASGEKKYMKIKMISNSYTYKDRDFGLKNYHFYCFIEKCKKYYAYKLKQKKSPKKLFLRQLYGKYT